MDYPITSRRGYALYDLEEQTSENIYTTKLDDSYSPSIAKIALFGGSLITVIGIIVMANASLGSTTFWLATAGLAFGVILLGSGLIGRRLVKNSVKNSLKELHDFNPKADSQNAYKKLLDKDFGAYYEVTIPRFIERGLKTYEKKGVEQTKLDCARFTSYCVDGEEILSEQLKKQKNSRDEETKGKAIEKICEILLKKYGEHVCKFANQLPMVEAIMLITSRYKENTSDDITIGNVTPKDGNYNGIKIDFIQGRILEITFRLKIMYHRNTLKYIDVNMQIDFKEPGDMIVSWKSPYSPYSF